MRDERARMACPDPVRRVYGSMKGPDKRQRCMFTCAIMLETLMTTLLKPSETGNGERFAVGLDMTRQPL